MSVKSGINKFVVKAVAVILKDYRQIYKGPMEGKPVVTPIDPEMLSYKEKRKALETI